MMKSLLLIFLALLKGSIEIHALQKQLPNIILIIVDDLGYSDLASYGNKNITHLILMD